MSFTEQLHPRGKGATGGQFVAKGSSGSTDTVGYDAKRGTGAGYGAKGGDARVKQLQNLLNDMGFTDSQGKPLKVDGKLGPKTTASIKRLQRKLGLKADGLVTPGLLKSLHHANHVRHTKAVAAKKASSQKRHTVARPVKKATPHHVPAKKAAPRKVAPAAKNPARYQHNANR